MIKYKMFGFIKKYLFLGMMFFGCNLSSVNPLKSISMNNQEWKVRPEIVNVNSDESVFFPFSIKTSRSKGNYNNINTPYAKLSVPDVVKNTNLKLFNLMSRTNKIRHIKCHDTSKCKCRLDASVFNNKQRWNKHNADLNVKNRLIKEYGIKRLFGIQVIVSVNLLNHVILVSIQIMKTVNLEKD